MSKRVGVTMILALAVILLFSNLAAAAKYKNLVGTWQGNSWAARWSNGSYFYDQGTSLALVIQDQDANGVFYGTFDGDPLTGSIATNKTITACVNIAPGDYGIINAKITGKKITGTCIEFRPDLMITTKFELTLQP